MKPRASGRRMDRSRTAFGLVAVLLAIVPGRAHPLAAQSPAELPGSLIPTSSAWSIPAPPGSVEPEWGRENTPTLTGVPAPGTWLWESGDRAPVLQATASRAAKAASLSLIVPGLGQRHLGARRAWLFIGLEAAGWFVWMNRRAAAADARDGYRDLAWEKGRIPSQPRVEGGFEYYETLTQWTRSGAYDSDPATSRVEPETDPGAYNGSIWTRARSVFSVPQDAGPSDPGYSAALDYYAERAFGEAFLWDWSNAPESQAALAEGIRESDDRYRQATTVLGILIANHFVAAVDAFVLGRAGVPDAAFRLSPEPRHGAGGWSAGLHIPVGR